MAERLTVGLLLLPQDHPHVSVGADLRQEEQGVLQLLLALPPLLLAGKGSVLPLIVQEAVEQVLVLEAQLLVHCGTTTASAPAPERKKKRL